MRKWLLAAAAAAIFVAPVAATAQAVAAQAHCMPNL
jgi:hypothetical protein